jgi:hypothetical protein
MNRLKTLALGLSTMIATTVSGQQYDYMLNSIFQQQVDDYIMLRLNRYRSEHNVLPLRNTLLPEPLQLANEEYTYDALYEDDSLQVDWLYDQYFNTDALNNAPGCIAYNSGGLTFTQQKTITFRKKDYATPDLVPKPADVINTYSNWNAFDMMVAPDSVYIMDSWLRDPDFQEVMRTGTDSTSRRWVSIAHHHGVNDVITIKDTPRRVTYQFELRYIVNLILYANKYITE